MSQEKAQPVLRFSRYSGPQVRMGTALLYPQNMVAGEDRVEYLSRTAAHLTRALRQHNLAAPVAQQLAAEAPLVGDLLVVAQGTKGLEVRPRPGAEDHLHFDRRRLTVCFPHGKRRGEGMYGVTSGEATPALSDLCQALRRGASRSSLARILREHLDDPLELIDAMQQRGVIERGAPLSPAPVDAQPGTRVTWMGHAALAVQSGQSTCWVDPWIPPCIEWTSAERTTLFSTRFAESQLFEAYGPGLKQICSYDLPAPDAVFITHQDRDHVDLGLLMTLPASAQIVVPESRPGRPWEVDLRALLRSVLGKRRPVRTLGHGKSLTVGSLRVTAFPFRGEMPASQPHSWNCYLFESAQGLVACTADSDVHEETVEVLTAAHRASGKPLTLFGTVPSDGDFGPAEDEDMLNPWRLHSWYQPAVDLFRSPGGASLPYQALRELKGRAGCSGFFAYGAGTAPWFRLRPEDPLALRVSSLPSSAWSRLKRRLAADPRFPRMLEIRYGKPLELQASRRETKASSRRT
jgi:L-ascorbate metabolism protein UlaG (beta-lactamase superfamily)